MASSRAGLVGGERQHGVAHGFFVTASGVDRGGTGQHARAFDSGVSFVEPAFAVAPRHLELARAAPTMNDLSAYRRLRKIWSRGMVVLGTGVPGAALVSSTRAHARDARAHRRHATPFKLLLVFTAQPWIDRVPATIERQCRPQAEEDTGWNNTNCRVFKLRAPLQR
ncbi:MAG: hypothetical protein WCB02_24175 [Bradyrhizobium sp.]